MTATPPVLVAAPDKFRGTASALEIAGALADAARAAGFHAIELPLADGGEGTLDALGGENRRTWVRGPLGGPVQAGWRIDGHTAVIELARASGLGLVGGAAANDPLRASTAGTGELLNAALRAGARKIILAVGGSATTDAGLGALETIDRGLLHNAELIVACDVRTSFLDAATVFGPQKGATDEQVALLGRRLRGLATRYKAEFGVDVATTPYSGAAGGLAGAMLTLGARLVNGFDLVADHLHLDEHLARAELVMTGEGCLDRSTLDGKVVAGVLSRAQRHCVKAAVVAGRVECGLSGAPAISLVEQFGERAAVTETMACARRAAQTLLCELGWPVG